MPQIATVLNYRKTQPEQGGITTNWVPEGSKKYNKRTKNKLPIFGL
jgi:hypothetical protein